MIGANPSVRSGAGIVLGLRENWQQFSLLVLINAFVGGMVGMQADGRPADRRRRIQDRFDDDRVCLHRQLWRRQGRSPISSPDILPTSTAAKHMLVLGWLIGLPVPFMIGWGPSWGWIIAANALLGINQGFAWSMTVIMKVDLVGPKSRGLAVGLNEFAGYLSVGVTAFLTGYIAQRYGLRPAPFYLGIGYAVLGLDSLGAARARHPPSRRPWRFPVIMRQPARQSGSGRSFGALRFETAICSRRRKPDWSTI